MTPDERPSAWGFHVGTFLAQLANNAFIVTLPLIVLQNYGSASFLGMLLAVATALDAAGTIIGGYLLSGISAKKLLIQSTSIRVVMLALIPILFPLGALRIELLVAIIFADALARGIADTCRYTVPLQHTDRSANSLTRFNGSYQFAFEAGGIAGPLLIGALLVALSTIAAHWLVIVSFVGALIGYCLLPRALNEHVKPAVATTPLDAINPRWVAMMLVAQACLTLNPLKTIFPAVFASEILKQPDATAWIVAAFGVGGLAGAVLTRQLKSRWPLRASLAAACIGTFLLALAWLPQNLWIMLVCVTTFATINVMARLQLLTYVQLVTPAAYVGGVIAKMRLTTNLSAMSVKFIAGLCLAAPNITVAFSLLSTGLIGSGIMQWIAGRYADAHQDRRLKDETLSVSCQA